MFKILLAGDLFISRPLPNIPYEGFSQLCELINDYEVKFANLETTLHNREGYPSAFPGGTWAMASPECVNDIKKLGFNILNTANNHTMDYLYGGLFSTLKVLKTNGISQVGSGKNLADASIPSFIECKDGRVAFVGATSSFHDSDAAGSQGKDIQGRPGVNPLRHKSIYEVTKEDFETLQKIASSLGINDYHDQAIKEGYLPENVNFKFASFEFIQGRINVLHTYPLEIDMDRIVNSIIEAKKQSDIVIVSIHSHQFSNKNKKNPPEFISSFAHRCIDAGATFIVGHGPHVLRGIEVYKNGVIFHGLGNFVFQNETVTHLPSDFYDKYSVAYNKGVGTAMEKRSKSGTIGLNIDKEAWESVIIGIEIEDKIIIKIFPIELGYEKPVYKRGLPKISEDVTILEKLAIDSKAYNTSIEISNNVGIIEIPLIL